MKILSAKQIQQADAYTIANEPIKSIDLMERASEKFTDAFCHLYPKKIHIAVVCGTGNNGGDGLAVSRLLQEHGYEVFPIIIQPKEGGSPDFLTNLERLSHLNLRIIKSESEVADFDEYEVIIDAILGSGLTRPVSGLYAKVIESINSSSASIVAIDIPSGLFMDAPASNGAIVRAMHTITFQLPKLAFLFPENYNYVGSWQIVDIGLNKEFIEGQHSNYSTLDRTVMKSSLPLRSKFDHKGSYGHAQLIGGSLGKMGAMLLAAEANLRSGAGLVSVNIPVCGQKIMQTSLPEAMLIDQSGENEIHAFNIIEKANIIGIGPGLGTNEPTKNGFSKFLQSNIKPLVIDADGINILAEKSELLELLPAGTILTPHIKEFDRLAGDSENNWQRLDKARSLTTRYKIIIVLKGAHTAIIDPDETISFNTTGNSGMATAGSGDVLFGIISGLLAQGCTPEEAAKLGVYLHGLSGDLAASKIGPRSLIASDLIKFLPDSFLELER